MTKEENKYKIALDNVKQAPEFMGGNSKYRGSTNSYIPFEEDIATLQELVEKEESKALVHEEDETSCGTYCPRCGEFILTPTLDKYCSNCGQKLYLGDDMFTPKDLIGYKDIKGKQIKVGDILKTNEAGWIGKVDIDEEGQPYITDSCGGYSYDFTNVEIIKGEAK